MSTESRSRGGPNNEGKRSYPVSLVRQVREAWASGEFSSDVEIAAAFNLNRPETILKWRKIGAPDGIPWEEVRAKMTQASLDVVAQRLGESNADSTLRHLKIVRAAQTTVARYIFGQRLELADGTTMTIPTVEPKTLGEAVKSIEKAERDIGMPASITTAFLGAARAYQASLNNELWLILAAIVTVYIVLGVLYESYVHPVTILSTLPSAGVGALLALMLAGQDLGVIGIIGIILLIGIVKKNAIMMIDFALDAERQGGLAPRDAIYQACLLRFRPIMMTTMAALLAGVPLAVTTGTGSELRRPLGITIVGGLLVSQILTLYTTPVIYLYFDRLARRISGRSQVLVTAPQMPSE